MYDIIKNVILNENFDLKWIILNIKKNCARGDITDDQEEELIVLAQRYAKPENSYAPLVWDPVTYPAYRQLVE